MSNCFKKFLLEMLRIKSQDLLVTLVITVLTLGFSSYDNAGVYFSIGILYISYFLIFDTSSTLNITERGFNYRARELLLLPLSKSEILILVMIEALVLSWIMGISLIIFSKIVRVIYLDWKVVIPFCLICCTYITASSSLNYNFTNFSKKNSLILFVKKLFLGSTFVTIVTTTVLLNKFFFKLSTLGLFVGILIVVSILLLIWIISNFKTSFFNEHKAFKRLIFSPIFDSLAIMYWLALSSFYLNSQYKIISFNV